MKTRAKQSRFHFAAQGTSLLALVATSAAFGLALISVTPANAEGNDKREEHKDKIDHRDKDHGGREQVERRRHEEPHYYPQPIYAPPNVYYPPQQSPGISLFLPLNVQIR